MLITRTDGGTAIFAEVDGVTIELYFRSSIGADAPIELARAVPLHALVAEIGQ